MKEKFIYQEKNLFMDVRIGKSIITEIRTPTPVKKVINYEYAEDAETHIRHSYDRFINEV